MRKTLGGIKHHWRPVYKSRAAATTISTTFQTVLNITGRGKIAVISNNYSWLAGFMETDVQIDGATTFVYIYKGNINHYRGDYYFNESIRVRHRIQPGSGGTVRTDVSYWKI